MPPTPNKAQITPENFNDYYSSLQTLALTSVRNGLALPQDVAFHRSMNPGFAREIDNVEKRVLALTSKLLSLSAGSDTTTEGSRKGKERACLQDQDDLIDTFQSLVVDVVDQLLERTDICLDQYLGRIKPPPAVPINPPKASTARKPPTKGNNEPVIQHASHIAKPQLSFIHPVDNSDSLWKPTLKHKYHAKVPLGYNFREASPTEGDKHEIAPLTYHPYHYELTHIEYPPHLFQPPQDSKAPGPLGDSRLQIITTPPELKAMLEKLKHAREIAVDLEWHGYRSFQGFLCLMQLSTREEDWIVDLLALRQTKGGHEALEEMGEIFADPNIVKVFHGADSDIVWLQQDFNLYVVNMFDTYHASKLLEFPRHGLANLLEMYCDFTPDKRYQLADWRIRPLPTEMLNYAHSDTHFLLYIYDQLRRALIDCASSRSQSPSVEPNLNVDITHRLIRKVLLRSSETCLRLYSKEPYDIESGAGRDGWDNLARKWNRPILAHDPTDDDLGGLLIRTQRAVYRAIHRWRDRVAREEDESPRYILPNHHLFQLAERVPNDMAALLGLFSSVPAVTKRRARELLDVIKKAAEAITPIILSVSDPVADTPQPITQQQTAPVEGVKLAPKSGVRDLWSLAGSATNDVTRATTSTTSSSLFGNSNKPSTSSTSQHAITTAPQPSIIIKESSLFGSTLGNVIPGRVQKTRAQFGSINATPTQSERFRTLVAKIHANLVAAPTLAQAGTVKEQKTGQSTAMDIDPPDPSQPSAPSRSTVTDAKTPHPSLTASALPHPSSADLEKTIIDDSIVVVAQPRQKKRKRNAIKQNQEQGRGQEHEQEQENEHGQENSASGAPGKEADGGDDRPGKGKDKKKKRRMSGERDDGGAEAGPDVVTFDFSTAPNILDDNPNPETEGKKALQLRKRKEKEKEKGGKKEKGKGKDTKGKGPKTFDGDFPAPPKAHSEVRSGNQSFTFK